MPELRLPFLNFVDGRLNRETLDNLVESRCSETLEVIRLQQESPQRFRTLAHLARRAPPHLVELDLQDKWTIRLSRGLPTEVVNHFAFESGRRHGRTVTLSPEARAALHSCSWPGNVGELALCDGNQPQVAQLGIGRNTLARKLADDLE
ncbi:MAG: hypothetical protein AAGA48_09400 [Myxococcota bacterium]